MGKNDLCPGCKAPVNQTHHIKCCTCKLQYDIASAGITEATFNLLSKQQKSSWACLSCRNKVPRTNNTNTPVRQMFIIDSKAISPSDNVTKRTRERREKTNGGGGVLIAINKSINSRQFKNYESDCEDLWVGLEIVANRKKEQLLICAVYLPPPVLKG
ncbi:unnamed protein product [Leptidea sinapis]|uniref:PHD-type domain-containing protein n=1 Tax=Leptidea sinapis TaxID=189913 RepID=A0A5E4QA63_9NEOP|nr:unnamed protein product [Leptidea sinapis]